MAQHPAWARVAGRSRAGQAHPGGAEDARTPNGGPTISAGPNRVHVETGTACAAPPPGDADVLFDGKNLDKWTGDHFGEWTVKDGVVTTGARVYNFLKTKESYRRRADPCGIAKSRQQPNPPVNPQYCGNSGVFPMGLYEVQILDTYKTETYPDGMVGAIYCQLPPLVNAARPAGVWQCYDIIFHAPHFSGNTVTAPARMTVMLNGVLVQDNTVLIGATVHGKVAHLCAACGGTAAGAAGSWQSRQPCLVPQYLGEAAQPGLSGLRPSLARRHSNAPSLPASGPDSRRVIGVLPI